MDELALLMGVQTEIWYIKDELKIMQAFLRTAERVKDSDELVKVWAEQVEDVSYDIKYCLDEFKANLGHPSCLQWLVKVRYRHQIAIQIRNLKVRVGEVSNRIQRYSHLKMPITSSSMDERKYYKDETISDMEDVHWSQSSIVESEQLCFSKHMAAMIKLMDVNMIHGPASVIHVVGMSGIGKTTLARKIYESDIRKEFFVCAWIIVSPSFVRMKFLKVMFKQLFGGEALRMQLEGNVVREEDLINCIRQELRDKRYFVVLDDIWSIDDWNWIKYIFPYNNKGSQIIVTMRDVGLAHMCTLEFGHTLIYRHPALEKNDAIKLLLRRARRSEEDMNNDQNMREVVTKILNISGKLPLAILTIGGMLSTRETSEWQSIYNQLPVELESNVSLEALRRMVAVSYYDLPSHLKPCFLYISIFPRNVEIQVRRLIDRWIAEGFATSRVGMDIEYVAKCHLYGLINRGMVQPSRVDIEGCVKSCRVHDVIFDIMESISRDENFVYFTRDIVTSAPEENFCHVAHHDQKWPKIGLDWSHVRSLSMFAVIPTEPTPPVCSAYLRMLSVLDLQDAQCSITQKDINNIGLLRRLKYLNVRGHSDICALPGSIGKLHGLQYLDARNSSITSLPSEISKLHSLISLRYSSKRVDLNGPQEGLTHTLCLPMVFTSFLNSVPRAESRGVRVPRGIGDLKELRILEVVDLKRTSSRAIKELGELMQLRKLSVVTGGATMTKCKVFCAAIVHLSSLRSLRVDAGTSSVKWLHSVSSPPPFMRRLKLAGFLGEMPDWLGSLMHLVKIRLQHSGLKGAKTMELLGTLPRLMFLGLHGNAYAGEQLVFGEEAFQNLRQLDLNGSTGVREVRFEEGTSPQMETMQLGHCELESGVIGVKHLPRLKEISLGSAGKVANLGVLEGEVDVHPNRPILRLKDDRRYHDLGDVVQGSTVAVQAGKATVEGHESSLHPDSAAATGESSSSHVVVMRTTEIDIDSQDSDIREVQGSALVEDDFWSCNSDDDDDA
ncbi:unnamed protein product [Triticum turgidum subsp. durum]|uniref:Uncharacterized protein n=1 Tax=Triticum turgidum subsp. durum TaxID=4567 RepID=A0A9R0SUR1_TRITD|nr:unnamed protein product [Triticum turgidum subsp. durum]